MAFFPGQIPSAEEMNALSQAADSAHLGAAGFLAADNGFEQVPRNPRRTVHAGASAAPKTDTAVAAASESAPQNRSVEVRAAVAATEADPEAGTDATPAAPAALQLYRFDEAEPEKGDGISATVTVPEKGGTCTVDFGLPAGATPGSSEIMLAARRIDPDTGARSLAWLKLGVAPGSEDGEEGGGEGGGGDGGGDGGECSEADAEAFPSDIEGDYDGGGGTGGWIGKEDDWDQKPFPSDDTDDPAPEDSERFPSKTGPCW
jgi:hypothetical protein